MTQETDVASLLDSSNEDIKQARTRPAKSALRAIANDLGLEINR